MIEPVEIFSATDPIYVPNRQVWYWTEFLGMKSQRATGYAPVLEGALALTVEHETCLVDRSDKGSGFLLATLDR
jgi:hypothetical protein